MLKRGIGQIITDLENSKDRLQPIGEATIKAIEEYSRPYKKALKKVEERLKKDKKLVRARP